MAIRWPRLLTPTHLTQLIRHQKNPLTALHLFNTAHLKYPSSSSSYRHNAPVYAAIIDTLSSSRLLPEMNSVIDHMIRDSCPSRDPVFARAIDTYARMGLPGDALALFSRIPLSNCVAWSHSFHSILKMLVDRGDLDAARQVFEENSNRGEVRIGIRSLNLLLGAMCRIRRPDLALEIFVEIREHCCYPDRETYRTLMKGLCEGGFLEDATHLLYSMLWRISQKGCDADVIVYRTLLEALCADGRVSEAEEILGKVLKKGLRSPKRRRAFQKPELGGRSLEENKKLINEALVEGGVRSLTSYSAMIVDLYSEGKFGDADRMLDEMLRRGFKPSVSTYEAKIAALCMEGRADDGARVLEEEMVERDCVPTTRTYNMVIEGLCNGGNSIRAVRYLDKMDRQVGCSTRKETYEMLVDGLCCEGQFLEAVRVLERMLKRRYWPGSAIYDSVIGGLCSLGRRYEAVLWLEEMVCQGKTPEINVWNSLVAMVCLDPAELSCWDALAHDLTDVE